MRSVRALVLTLALFLLIGAVAVHAARRENQAIAKAAALTGGDPTRGPARRFSTVRGVSRNPRRAGPSGRVGPPLTTIAERVYLGGVATNTPQISFAGSSTRRT